MKALTREQAIHLIAWGATKIGLFNGALEESDEMRVLSNKQMVVVATTYAAAIAQETKLDLAEFLEFATIAYQNVYITKREAEALGNSDTGGLQPPDGGDGAEVAEQPASAEHAVVRISDHVGDDERYVGDDERSDG
jgi:hypothetical protein